MLCSVHCAAALDVGGLAQCTMHIAHAQRVLHTQAERERCALCKCVINIFMSPLRRHIFVCFMGKNWVFSALAPRGRTHIMLG